MLATGTITPECCTHWGKGFVVSLTGGRGENILTSLEVGGVGAGAMREARSMGGRAGSERPGGGGKEPAGGGGEWAPGEDWPVVVVDEKKVRLGLATIGVPSSSRSVGGVEEWRSCVRVCCS